MSSFLALVALHKGHFNKRRAPGTLQPSGDRVDDGYHNAELELLDLAAHITEGRAWVACHLAGQEADTEGRVLQGGHRHEDKAGGCNLVVLDIDGDLTLEEFWANPRVERHCCFTYTSASHRKATEKNPEARDRFRAIFRVDTHQGGRLHAALYRTALAWLGLPTLIDKSGEKPERLWFGYDRSEIRYGLAEALPWELLAEAEEIAAKEERERPVLPAGPADPDDIARADYLLRHVLPPSRHNDAVFGYESYWQVLMHAAASAGDALFDAFWEWSSRGEHHKQEERRLRRGNRFAKAGNRSGIAVIFAQAKAHCGEGWRDHLPEGLRGVGKQPPVLRVLFSSRTASDIAPVGGPSSLSTPQPTVPDRVPPTEALEALERTAPQRLIQTRAADLSGGSTPAAKDKSLDLDAHLRRLYHLRAHGLLLDGDDLQVVPTQRIPTLDRELLGALLEHPGYSGSAAEVERDLLGLFRHEHGLALNPNAEVTAFRLTGDGRATASWLIPGLILTGRDHVLYARGGVGKTTLALHLARALTGDPSVSQFLDSGNLHNHHLWGLSEVLFIGTDMYDSAEEMTNTYLQQSGLSNLAFLEHVTWWFQCEKKKTPPWLLTLKDLIQLHNFLEGMAAQGKPVSTVIIDSMKAVCPDHILVGQQAFKDYIKLVYDICARHKAALIWIHHARGDGSGAQGIQRITEATAGVFHLERSKENQQLTLHIEKLRGGGKPRDLIVDLFGEYGPRMLGYAGTDPEEPDDDTANDDQLHQLVLELIQDDFRRFRLSRPDLLGPSLELAYPGLSFRALLTAFREPAMALRVGRIGEHRLRSILADLITDGDLKARGHARSRAYILSPCFIADSPAQQTLIDPFVDAD